VLGPLYDRAWSAIMRDIIVNVGGLGAAVPRRQAEQLGTQPRGSGHAYPSRAPGHPTRPGGHMSNPTILSGSALAASLNAETTRRAAALPATTTLATVLVGDDPGSHGRDRLVKPSGRYSPPSAI
jgi:hypothetical protein